MWVEIALFLLLLALYLGMSSRKPANMPPGSFGLPILGSLPSLKRKSVEHLRDLQQKYGDVFTTKWGSHPLVVIADYEVAKKAFGHPDLQGRPDFYAFKVFNHYTNAGVIDSTGEVWSENRRFMLRQLRDLGMGKTVLENSIQDEASMLVDHLEKTCLNKPSEMDLSINVAVVNVIWQLLAGKRYDCDDELMLSYNRLTTENVDIFIGSALILNLFPILPKVLPSVITKKYMRIGIMEKNMNTFNDICRNIIKEHAATLDPDNPRDVIDQFILTHQKDDKGTIPKNEELDFLCTMNDMFMAGSETTSNTLRWFVLYMALNPKIQAKLHQLLDEVVPKGSLPSLMHRNDLQYLDAVLLEVMRISSLVPIGVLHTATADTQLEGYFIPKDTVVMACTELCHNDPRYWEKPNEFYPEHFLDKDGKLNSKKEGFIPFSVGRRQCLGESLARMELYLFGSAIIQRFIIEPPSGETLKPAVDPAKVQLNAPLPFNVVLRKRS